jgi:uncharacterized membrane protein YsdA (DUF1294 family)
MYLLNYPYLYLIWLALLSVILFILYGFDKARARSGGWRIPESTLHGMAIFGGVIGGWLGRSVFRHKTRKKLFTFVLVIGTLIHLGIAYLLFM